MHRTVPIFVDRSAAKSPISGRVRYPSGRSRKHQSPAATGAPRPRCGIDNRLPLTEHVMGRMGDCESVETSRTRLMTAPATALSKQPRKCPVGLDVCANTQDSGGFEGEVRTVKPSSHRFGLAYSTTRTASGPPLAASDEPSNAILLMDVSPGVGQGAGDASQSAKPGQEFESIMRRARP